MTTPRLTDEQSAAIAKATSARLGILTGGGGTGKTFTVTNYLRQFTPAEHRLFAAVAPTGKAAQRLGELLSDAGINIIATTVHQLLKPLKNGHGTGDWGFSYNSRNRLPFELIIADEWSMADQYLCHSLLSAAKDTCQVIQVGDPWQLPPVGKGRPFADQIESGIVPHGHIEHIHRYAGRIAHVCQSIRKGQPWQPSACADLAAESPENMVHYECSQPLVAVARIDAIIDKMGRLDGVDVLRDVQILVARNDQGPLSRKSLNKRYQDMLNPLRNGDGDRKATFRPGDKVICLQNCWRRPMEKTASGEFRNAGDESDERRVANGEIGIVLQAEQKQVTAVFPGGIFRWYGKKDKPLTGQIDLAYAITVWKSQGSQWKVPIVIADNSRNVDRSYWYTGISRATMLSITVGRRAMIDQQCKQVDMRRRLTLLKERIAEAAAS